MDNRFVHTYLAVFTRKTDGKIEAFFRTWPTMSIKGRWSLERSTAKHCQKPRAFLARR